MKIYLLNNHEAVVIDGRSGVVSVEPPCHGTLSVDGHAVRVENGVTNTPVFEEVGATHATFTTDKGIRYQVVSPYLSQGRLISRVDPIRGYVEARMYVDRLEKRVEELDAELRSFKGSIQHDSLGFMIKKED